MKGTFFSTDFVTDNAGNLRLLEINTDTGAVPSQMVSFDWTDFITVLSNSNINELVVVYKWELQKDIVASLSNAISTSAPFITTYNEIIVPGESIFPTSPEDGANKFILRLAYDETAILDSEYAKGTLNLLKLFVDNDDAESVTGFQHSSSLYGTYDTLDKTLFNEINVPDLVSKSIVENHSSHGFYKIGKSELTDSERYAGILDDLSDSNKVIQQYHVSPEQISANKVSTIRSFQVVYGSNLDVCYVSQYEVDAIFSLPTTLNVDDTQFANNLESKHYYEFATNHIKDQNHGLLGDELVLDDQNVGTPISDLVVGDTYKSHYIDGAPNTDDEEILRTWSTTGNTLPSGSYETTSILVNSINYETYANDLLDIQFGNGSNLYIGGETRMLVHNGVDNTISYKKVKDLTTNYSIFQNDGTLTPIVSIDVIIFEEPQTVYTLNMEEVDNFVIDSDNFISLFFITHNAIITSCFVAGTKIKMADGTEKNIEDIKIDDEVLSFNETTGTNESKKVVSLNDPIHNDLIKVKLSNGIEIMCTQDHPFYVEGLNIASYKPNLTNERYNIGKEAIQLKQGDLVRLSTSSQTAVVGVEELPLQDTQTYIFTVEDNHNFYANGVLVHNK